MQPWFIWNRESSLDYGLWIGELPAPTRAEERTEGIKIPGRAGVLTYKEGENVHDEYVKEVPVQVRADADFAPILNWLTGSGEVIFSNEPDRVYFAHISGEVAFDKVSNGLKQATIPFAVHPHKGMYPPETEITLASGGTVYNPGTVAAKPIISLTFTGSTTITVNNDAMILHSTPTTATKSAIAAYTQLDPQEIEEHDDTIGAVMDGVFGVGNVNLRARPKVPMSEMSAWTEDTQGYATVMPRMYTLENGLIVHVTPIIAASSSSYTVMTVAQMETYIDALEDLADAGAILDYDAENNGIVLWVQPNTSFAQNIGNQYDESLTLLQAAYYSVETSNLPTADTLLSLLDSTRPEGETLIPTTSSVNVDSDACIITDDGGIWMGSSEGDFPVLKQGENTITATVALTIKPRWRWF